MKVSTRVSSALVALGLLAAPALAQNSTQPAPASNDVVGPPQLENFSLNGTVTRRAEPAPTPPARSQPAPRETAAAPRAEPPAARSEPAPAGQRQARAETPREAPAGTGSTLPFDMGAATPAADEGASFAADAFAPQPASSSDVGALGPATADSDPWAARLPWLLALLAAIGAGAWYFRRQRSLAFAGTGGEASQFDLGPAAAPTPRPAPPPPVAPQPAPPPVPVGIVSTRLRPWLELEFAPEAAIIDGERCTVEFVLTVFNSGGAPARDILIEAMLFNAGPDQDQAISGFFAKQAGPGERVPVIDPLQRMTFRSAVTVPRDQMRIFGAGERQVFVPLIGFNALYSWSAGSGQSSASFLIGRDTAGDKMAPLRVDQGARTYRGLGARAHSVSIRK